MRLYNRKNHRYVERQIHFGVGQSVKTVCGVVLHSRHVMVSAFSDSDGALITDNLGRVTCKKCLATRDIRLRKLIAIEQVVPGVFDRETLCGEKWLLDNALTVNQGDIDRQELSINLEGKTVTIPNKIIPKDRKQLIRDYMREKVHASDTPTHKGER